MNFDSFWEYSGFFFEATCVTDLKIHLSHVFTRLKIHCHDSNIAEATKNKYCQGLKIWTLLFKRWMALSTPLDKFVSSL